MTMIHIREDGIEMINMAIHRIILIHQTKNPILDAEEGVEIRRTATEVGMSTTMMNVVIGGKEGRDIPGGGVEEDRKSVV